MNFDFEMSLALLESLPPEERAHLLTAAGFLMTAYTDEGEVYGFTALKARDIHIARIPAAMVVTQNDVGEYVRVKESGGIVRVTFECDADKIFGTLLKSTPPSEQAEEKKFEKQFARFILKREERNIIV